MPESFRVAIVTRTFPPRGGGIAAAHYNLFHLLQHDHEVKAFAFDDDSAGPVEGVVRRKTSRVVARLLEAAAARYVRRFDRSAPAVYVRSIAAVAPAARALSVPLREFEPDIVIVPDNYVPALAMKFPKSASVVWMSRNNYKRFENQPLVHKRSWMDIHLAHRLELRALRKAHHVVCPSRYMQRVFRETYPVDLPIDVIPNFVHPSTLQGIAPADLRARFDMKAGERLIYIPSAGSPVKGKRYVFEIIRRLSEGSKAAFYLSGAIDRDLAAEITALGDNARVFAPGQVAYAENLRYVAACDFAVSPTLIENLSNALVEALVLGLPVVTFDVGGNTEIVSDGENGFIVPLLDIERLVARARHLLDDSELLTQMRGSAADSLVEMTDAGLLRSKYQGVFDQLRRRT